MSNLWKIDSRFMQTMTLITNLVFVNLLWLLCSLPIITAGAATSAMYSVLFAYREKKTDSVFKPFFSAFKRNFRQSTVIWLILLAVTLVLGYDVLYLIFEIKKFSFLGIPVIIAGLLILISGAYIFPQIAMFQNKLISMVKNSFLLFMLFPILSVAIILLNLLPWILLLFSPQVFWLTILVWTLIGFALLAYLNCYLLHFIFKRYLPTQEE